MADEPAAAPLELSYVPAPHLDLFWLGTHFTCLERGASLIRAYLDACLADPQQTFLIETPIFADYFLKRYPSYREPLRTLLHEGRVEVGACYVDSLETIDPDESLIRHHLFGKRWCREQLGMDPKLVCHFDLPGYIPQIAQLCAGSGITFYLTSRKAFPAGKVFRYVSPDGSKVLCLHFPLGYSHHKLEEVLPHLGEIAHGFPRGVALMAGGAGDLAGLETFVQRNGKPLVDLLAEAREAHPELCLRFGTAASVFDLYASEDLPEYTGQVPSVWGPATPLASASFGLMHELEATLVAAEQLVALAGLFGRPALPERQEIWKGVLHDDCFFGPKDLIPAGRELEELWRLQLATEDHNGGGKEGVLTEFYKLDMRRRGIAYGRELVHHGLAQLLGTLPVDAGGPPGEHIGQPSRWRPDTSAGEVARYHRSDRPGSTVALYNPLSWPRKEVVELAVPSGLATEGAPVIVQDGDGTTLPSQRTGDGAVRVLVQDLPPLGYTTLRVIPAPAPATTMPPAGKANRMRAEQHHDGITVRTPTVSLTVDQQGTIASLRLAGDDHELMAPSGQAGQLVAYRELDNEVRMRLAEGGPAAEAETVHVRLGTVDELTARIVIERRLLEAVCHQTISVYADLPRVDLETRLFWWGAPGWQVRLRLPFAPDFDQVHYGTPFHATNWRDLMPASGPSRRDEVLPDDWARSREVLRWIDASDGQRGVTVTSTSGAYWGDGPQLEAVLLRTPYSCGDARFVWDNSGALAWQHRLWPHQGDWREAQAYRRGWEQTATIQHLSLGERPDAPVAPAGAALLRHSPNHLVLTCLKPAEQGEGVIVRFYEAEGRAATARIVLAIPIRAARRTNLIEDDGEALAVDGGEVAVDVEPWQIVTLRLVT